jgi:membrane-associated phospholipid phosphatase
MYICLMNKLIFILLIPLFLQGQYSSFNTESSRTLPLLGAGSICLISGNVFAHQVKPLKPEEISILSRTNLDILDRTATFNYSISAKKNSDRLMLSSILIPAILMTNENARENIDKIALMTAETYLLTIGTTYLTKSLVKRTRPFVYNPDAPLSDKIKADARMSFFSGHTSFTTATTFYTASMLSQNPENRAAMPYIWTTAAAIPAITGYLRCKAGKHFPTDIFIGYAVGLGIGLLIPELHK